MAEDSKAASSREKAAAVVFALILVLASAAVQEQLPVLLISPHCVPTVASYSTCKVRAFFSKLNRGEKPSSFNQVNRGIALDQFIRRM